MWYSDGTHTIWINKELFEQTDMEYNAKSIVHEMVHAFTSRSFENVKRGIGTDLEIKVYNKVKDLLNFNRKLY
nr:MAG: Peptidase M76 family protein [Bacteriophage sp.]